MNWWADENNFNRWKAKINKAGYEEQKQELLKDFSELEFETALDVGGGTGRIGVGKVLDISQGFDITKPWDQQGITGKYDLVFTSITLIALNEEEVNATLKQMFKHAKKYIYFYEEKPAQGTKCGELIANDFGEKYAHYWTGHIYRMLGNRNANVNYRQSQIKPDAWERILITL